MLAAALPLIAVGVLFILVNSRLAEREWATTCQPWPTSWAPTAARRWPSTTPKPRRRRSHRSGRTPASPPPASIGRTARSSPPTLRQENHRSSRRRRLRTAIRMADGYMTAFQRIFEGQARIGTLFLKARTDQLQAAHPEIRPDRRRRAADLSRCWPISWPCCCGGWSPGRSRNSPPPRSPSRTGTITPFASACAAATNSACSASASTACSLKSSAATRNWSTTACTWRNSSRSERTTWRSRRERPTRRRRPRRSSWPT